MKKTGLLALLSQGSLASSAVLGSPALGGELQAAMAGLQGPRSLAAGGMGGLRSRGGGSGGGDGSVAIGSLHTRSGSGLPAASLGVGRHKSVRLLSPRTVLGEGLGRTDVARVMRRNRARFKYCYERQLNRHPNLQGKLSLRFTIAPDGRVAKVALQESTLHNADVEGCVQNVVGTLRFPKPRGGGVVIVSYPFLFAQSN